RSEYEQRVSSRKGHQGLPVETHPHELASAQATQGPRASEEDALLFFGRADPVPQTPKNSEDNRGSERHRRPRDDTPLPRVVTGDCPMVTGTWDEPLMWLSTPGRSSIRLRAIHYENRPVCSQRSKDCAFDREKTLFDFGINGIQPG